jgi:hypothetical protein
VSGLLFGNRRRIDRRPDEATSKVHLVLAPKDDYTDRTLSRVSTSPEILLSGPAAKVLELSSSGILHVAFTKSLGEEVPYLTTAKKQRICDGGSQHD